MRRLLSTVLALTLVVGCGGGKEKAQALPLDQVPDAVMKAAQKRLPDVKFDHAQRKANGEYEVIGKNKQGKVMEVEVTAAGEVTAVE